MAPEPHGGGGVVPRPGEAGGGLPAAHAAAAAAACQQPQRAGAAGEAPAPAGPAAAASAFEEEWRVMSVTYPTALLHHEGKRINLHELVCGNFVGVRGRKLEAIRAQLGSAGYHLRVNHALVEADERVTYVSIQVSVLGLVMDAALRLLLDSFTAAAHGVLAVHPRAGEIRVAATIAGAEVIASVTARGVAQKVDGVPQSAAAPTAAPAAPAGGTPLARPRTLPRLATPVALPVEPAARAVAVDPAPAAVMTAALERPGQPPLELSIAALRQLQGWTSAARMNGSATAPPSVEAAARSTLPTSPASSLAATPPVSRSSSGGSSSSSLAPLPAPHSSLSGVRLDGAPSKGCASADDFLAKLLLGSDLLALL